MKCRKRSDYELRKNVLKLLPNDAAATIACAETGPSLPIGAEYIDLERLEQGVQCVGQATPLTWPLQRSALAKAVVREDVWRQILAQIGHWLHAAAQSTA